MISLRLTVSKNGAPMSELFVCQTISLRVALPDLYRFFVHVKLVQLDTTT